MIFLPELISDGILEIIVILKFILCSDGALFSNDHIIFPNQVERITYHPKILRLIQTYQPMFVMIFQENHMRSHLALKQFNKAVKHLPYARYRNKYEFYTATCMYPQICQYFTTKTMYPILKKFENGLWVEDYDG